jgi:hypothetical protein
LRRCRSSVVRPGRVPSLVTLGLAQPATEGFRASGARPRAPRPSARPAPAPPEVPALFWHGPILSRPGASGRFGVVHCAPTAIPRKRGRSSIRSSCT